jgi:hypothetical protein
LRGSPDLGWGALIAALQPGSSPWIAIMRGDDHRRIARQVLKKVLTGPSVVTASVDCWSFKGSSRIDRVLQGSVAHGEVVVVRWNRGAPRV